MKLSETDLRAVFQLEPKAAIAYLKSKGYKLGWNWQETLDEANGRAFTVAKVARLDVLQDLHEGLSDVLKQGLTGRDFEKHLTPILQAKGWWGKQVIVDSKGNAEVAQLGSPSRLRTIYQTNTQSAYNAGREQSMREAADSHPFWQYVAVLDGRTRPSHRAMNGRVFPADDPLWQTAYPPNGFNCFPSGTPVRADAVIGLKTWYAGKMVQLKTRHGNDLTVTAHHPVLTARGWVCAHGLQESDQVLADRSVMNAAVVGVVDDQQPPLQAEQLFETLKAEGFRIVPMAPDDFHGDAHCRKSEIHVAGSDRHLMNELDTLPDQYVGQRQFLGADGGLVRHADIAHGAAQGGAVIMDTVGSQNAADIAEAGSGLLGDGALGCQAGAVEGQNAPFEHRVAPPRRLPGGAQLAGDSGGIGFKGLPLDRFGFASTPEFNAVPLEQPAQGVTAEAGFFRELLEANATGIAADEIIEIRHFDWAGHVYDFQTKTGLIIAGAIIVHNCRCRVRAVNRRTLEREKRVPESSEGKLRTITVEAGTDKRTGEMTQARRTGIDLIDRNGQPVFFAPDAGFNSSPARGAFKPFTPPPLDDLPRTFPPGQVLPALPRPAPFDPARLLKPGLTEEEYVQGFLQAFGAGIGRPVVFRDVKGEPVTLNEDLFKDKNGHWKVRKNGREVYLPMLAEAIKAPDEIWLHWQPVKSGGHVLRRRYLKCFQVEGGDVPSLAVFEEGVDGWSGVTIFQVSDQEARRSGFADAGVYINAQRGGFLVYRRH
jgi:SPP1 gp7 family putative phage head morphogenesis protein